MSKLPNDCICLFSFQVGWGGGEWWFEGDSTWLIHYKKNHQNTQTATQLYCWIPSNFVLQLYSFDSGYSLVVVGEGERRYKRGSDITIFSPSIAFYFFYYHRMNLLYSFIISKILVYIFNSFFDKPLKFNRKRLSHKLCYISGIFDNILRWKRYFNDILWTPPNNNNTLPDTGISSNKI